MQLQDSLECSSREAHLTLQILLDRILKKIIHNLGEAASNKRKREANLHKRSHMQWRAMLFSTWQPL